jgi:hypothetical protein
MRPRRTLLLIVFLVSVLSLTACPSRTTIGKITADPGRYENKEVAVAGSVTNSYSVPVLGGAYELDDGTGKMWVISQGRGTPTRGAKVGARGRIRSGVTFGARNFGTILEENERRSK